VRFGRPAALVLPRYQAGFSLVVDRRGLSEPPPAGTVRAVVDFLRTREKETGAC